MVAYIRWLHEKEEKIGSTSKKNKRLSKSRLEYYNNDEFGGRFGVCVRIIDKIGPAIEHAKSE